MGKLWLLGIGGVLAAVLLGSPAYGQHQQVEIEVKAVTPERQDDYYVNLLKLLLAASKAPEEVLLYRFADRQFAQRRWLTELSREQGNGVLWTVTTREREQILRPIRYPAFRGLIGQRALVIRRVDLAKFAAVEDIDDLRQLHAGQGVQWPDTDILRANGLPVLEALGKEQLYKMLAVKRIDYFPRGVMEIASEQEFLRKYDLVVEPRLVLSYPAALYYFVNRQNTELAQRLEKGWEIILRNGEFDRFFYTHPRVVAALEFLTSGPRQAINLSNPLLPESAQVLPLDYWLTNTSWRRYQSQTATSAAKTSATE